MVIWSRKTATGKNKYNICMRETPRGCPCKIWPLNKTQNGKSFTAPYVDGRGVSLAFKDAVHRKQSDFSAQCLVTYTTLLLIWFPVLCVCVERDSGHANLAEVCSFSLQFTGQVFYVFFSITLAGHCFTLFCKRADVSTTCAVM